MLQLEPGMIIWTWATFVVLMVLLYRVAWKPLVAMIDERDKAIAEGLRKAEQAREEAESLMKEQKEKLAKTHDEAKAMLETSKKTAENTKTDLINQAREEANKIIERGKADLERERHDAVFKMKKDISALVVQAASKLIGMSLDEKKHQELIEESIQKLDKN
jgi:F-type H+-transporting ATPase subunit b